MTQIVTLSAVDPSIALSQRGKFLVIATGSMDIDAAGRPIYLRDIVRGRFEAPKQIEVITDHYLKWRDQNHLGVGIEETFWQTSLLQYLREAGVVPIFPINRRKQGGADTGTRAMLLASRYEQQQIHHPTTNPPWLAAFEDELLAFTGEKGRDEYTDQVSAWCDVVSEFTKLLATRYARAQEPPRYGRFSYDDGLWGAGRQGGS